VGPFVTNDAGPCRDKAIADQWYAVAALPECPPGAALHTSLLGVEIRYGVDGSGRPFASRVDESRGAIACRVDGSRGAIALPVTAQYGYLWTTIGEPARPVFSIPETAEPDRRVFNAATMGVHVSGPRAIDNFLDMGHLPFVHVGVLGQPPHTEISDYEAELVDDEIWARRCRIFQPKAAAASSVGTTVEYDFRVPHPMCALLYKTTPGQTRLDVLGLFAHPLQEDQVRVHLFNCILDETSSLAEIRRFQQGVLAQDKPILENQRPKCLPLEPRAEVPVRSDKTGILYRRWLAQLGVTYGVIPDASQSVRRGDSPHQ
jgi:phenylpropionate dioxygenase-like ring-hydroxylating dioxygenase large terminal subunit